MIRGTSSVVSPLLPLPPSQSVPRQSESPVNFQIGPCPPLLSRLSCLSISPGCRGRDITGLQDPSPQAGGFCDFSSYLLPLLILPPQATLASSVSTTGCVPAGLRAFALTLPSAWSSPPHLSLSPLGSLLICGLFSEATLTTSHHIALTPHPSPEPSLLYFSLYCFSPSDLL